MATIKSFNELKVWKDSRQIVKEVYDIIHYFPKRESYGLISQITRASVSIMSNIAEGFARDTNKEFIRFLIMSRGSVAEVQSDLFVALDLEFIDKDKFSDIYSQLENLGKQINGLIRYLRLNTKIKNEKYNVSETLVDYETNG
jgi:four helix bundle protein